MRAHLAEHLAGDVDAFSFALESGEHDGSAAERSIPLHPHGDRARHVLLPRHARMPGLRQRYAAAEIDAFVADVICLDVCHRAHYSRSSPIREEECRSWLTCVVPCDEGRLTLLAQGREGL